jgi:hypothetical protein
MNQNDTLPESSASTDGATKGSLGGASIADVKRGYSDASAGDHMPDLQCCCPMCVGEKQGGFLGRPQGFER